LNGRLKSNKNDDNMKFNLEWVIENFTKGAKPDFLFFWGHQKSENGGLTKSCLSQWWPSPFVVEGTVYHTAEHWMMAQKALLFDDRESFEKIILAESPQKAKKMGRQVRNFNEDIWKSKRMDIVVQGTLHKFNQNNGLRSFLIDTNDKILVEASPVDKIWGIGLDAENKNAKNPKRWEGLNLLGFALMEVRDLLRLDNSPCGN